MFTIRYPEDLPISIRRSEIIAAIRNNQVVVIAGETGSGKTTQLPKMCLDAGLAERGRIGCTQPRRVAALSVSKRVAEELAVSWGREVGCKMRFNDDTGPDTRVKFMTDGILLAEIQSDPLLRSYSALILDEAHERSLNIDFLLGYLQSLLQKRPDLKLIVTSATIDTETFSNAFGGAPIIEVSGRLYPVEIRYAPVESFAGHNEDTDTLNHVTAAVRATEDALLESPNGDILIFMPTEREIRETSELLETSLGSGIEVLGLFGRMPAAEQQRIFTPGPRRRVIVATNIAETSLTLPRIRYVIDSGLARVSRYNPRTRTKRLPVEEVAQSSANQRAGRAGRIQDGICIRLYSIEDFEKRPRFTQPEIQRANLAEVILRMTAFRLGEIETFPFINPPQHAAIRAGYRLLHELGAITETNDLTALGRELARLPIDPTLGRMLLQGRTEGSLNEVLVIAAGLSVPDVRERPDDNREAAESAHQRFADPDSDFLSLLNIWKAAPSAEGRGSGNALRRFCKQNFLSVSRMREWRDIHVQLEDAVPPEVPQRNRPAPSPKRGNTLAAMDADTAASYTSVHRAILTGLLGHIAQRHERNIYKAAGNRQVTLFPGSNLYERREKPRKGRSTPASQEPKSKQPHWIVAGEIVETSQLFARMAAGINPNWIQDLGPHLCQSRYIEPHWSSKASRVLVSERVFLHGLEVSRRHVDFGLVDPAAATEIFIRCALVAEDARISLRFFSENRKVREKVENALTRVRNSRAMDLEEAFYQFYAARIHNVSSVHDLNKFVNDRIARDPDFLCVTEADLIGKEDPTYDRHLFPDKVSLGNTALPLSYAFSPGEENDGVTIKVPLPVAEHLTTGQLQWMIPGLREEQISILLRALPKAIRKALMPLEPKITEVAQEFQPGRGEFLVSLADFLTRKYRIHVRASDWPELSLPPHLRPRVEIVDKRNQTVAAGRDLEAIQSEVEKCGAESRAWVTAAKRWEKRDVKNWCFGDLPESVVIEEIGGAPVLAYPGLEAVGSVVNVRLFKKQPEAQVASIEGVMCIAKGLLAKDLAYVHKEFIGLSRIASSGSHGGSNFQNALQQLSSNLKTATPSAFSEEILQKCAQENLLKHTLTLSPVFPLTEKRLKELTDSARRDFPGIAYQLRERAKQILTLRQTLLAIPKGHATLKEDIARLVPEDFLSKTPFNQLNNLLRYLKAVQVRATKAALHPAKDTERAAQLAPYRQWEKQVAPEKHEAFRWLLEEFRVSVFAQELGTAQPVSATRLNALGGF
ncbi:MAG: ATP-dependent RNA helicase HrpA [Verrucomicrobiota bacterium]